MKKIISLLSFLLLFLVPGFAHAAVFETGDVFIVDKSEVISDDLFVGAERVQINGTVDGDVFVGASIVDISGEVTGSVFTGASEVNVSGAVGNDLFIGAGTTRISGTVGDNVYVGTGILTTTDSFTSGKDLIVGAGDASVDGVVGKNLAAGAGALTLLGQINESAYLSVDGEGNNSSQSGRITLGKGAVVQGNFEYESDEKAEIQRGAKVIGRTQFTPIDSGNSPNSPKSYTMDFPMNNPIFKIVGWIGGLIWALIIAFIFVAVYSKDKIKKIDAGARENIGRTFGYGILTGIAAPVIIFLIALTIIGIPIAIILGFLYTLLIYAATAFVSVLVGRLIFGEKPEDDKQSMYLSALIGVLIISVLGAIPFLGGAIDLTVAVFGLGALTLNWKARRDAKKKTSSTIKTTAKKASTEKVKKAPKSTKKEQKSTGKKGSTKKK